MITDYSCVIIDDEALSIQLLDARIKHLNPYINITNHYTHWEDALLGLRNNEPDIIFIDVVMPEKTGIELLQLLPRLQSEIIFTTAHQEYAVKAFSFSASGYLLKPIDDDALKKTLDLAVIRVWNKKCANQASTVPKINKSRIGIPNNNAIDFINIEDIIYFEAQNKYTSIVTHKTRLLSSYGMNKFFSVLEGHSFYQVHRSYIVNLKCIDRYESNGLITLCDKTQIPVARSERKNFLNFFSKVNPLLPDTEY